MSRPIGQQGGGSPAARAHPLVLVLHGSCLPWFFFDWPFPTTVRSYPAEPWTVFPLTVEPSPVLAYLVRPWPALPVWVSNLGCRAGSGVFHLSLPPDSARPRLPRETAGNDWSRRFRALCGPARPAARAGSQWSACRDR